MTTIEKRLDDLEEKVNPPQAGQLAVCWLVKCPRSLCADERLWQEPTPEEKERRIAEAHERAGENGVVLVVVYEQTEPEDTDHDWH